MTLKVKGVKRHYTEIAKLTTLATLCRLFTRKLYLRATITRAHLENRHVTFTFTSFIAEGGKLSGEGFFKVLLESELIIKVRSLCLIIYVVLLSNFLKYIYAAKLTCCRDVKAFQD